MTLLVIVVATFTTLQWWDRGSGGSLDGAYWAPNLPSGYYSLGSMGTNTYSNPGQVIPGNTFYAVRSDTDPSALDYPLGFEQIWNDRGSGANEDGSMWRIVCREGYVGLGTVAQRGYNPPRADSVRCVKKEYTVPGKIGQLVWDDRRTGSKRDFGSWIIEDAPDSKPGLPVGTFYGRASHQPPKNPADLYVLDLNKVEIIEQ